MESKLNLNFNLVEQARRDNGLLGREMFGAGGGRMDGAYRDAIDEE